MSSNYYEFSWEELLLKPVDFEFGPNQDYPYKHSKAAEEPIIQKNGFQSKFSRFDISKFIIAFAVNSAVFLKQSTIPDRLVNVSEKAYTTSLLLEQHYAIKEKVKRIGHKFVDTFLIMFTTFIAALLQATIAYHNTPGLEKPKENSITLDHFNEIEQTNPETLITLNVGGSIFTTQLLTIMARKKTRLGRLALSRHSSNSVVFIDRDGKHFRHILNYLRGIDTVSHLECFGTLSDLLVEAEYYELNALQNLISDRLDHIMRLETTL